jgi:hypothetical protein
MENAKENVKENLKKRKAQSKLEVVPTQEKLRKMQGTEATISPTSKIQVLKLDVIACNGQPISQNTELGSSDLENIWTQTLGRSIDEVNGYSSNKARSKDIRIQYLLKKPMSIKEIISENEFTHERSSVFATDNFRIRVVGLGEVRQARIGETVRVTVNLPNFDITPDQIIEWMSKFGKIKDGHRYYNIFSQVKS